MREGNGEREREKGEREGITKERGRYVSLQLKVLCDYIWKRKDTGMEGGRRERGELQRREGDICSQEGEVISCEPLVNYQHIAKQKNSTR